MTPPPTLAVLSAKTRTPTVKPRNSKLTSLPTIPAMVSTRVQELATVVTAAPLVAMEDTLHLLTVVSDPTVDSSNLTAVSPSAETHMAVNLSVETHMVDSPSEVLDSLSEAPDNPTVVPVNPSEALDSHSVALKVDSHSVDSNPSVARETLTASLTATTTDLEAPRTVTTDGEHLLVYLPIRRCHTTCRNHMCSIIDRSSLF